MSKKKYTIRIFYIDKNTKEVNAQEKLRTKPMTESEFKELLPKRLSQSEKLCKKNEIIAYTTGDWIK